MSQKQKTVLGLTPFHGITFQFYWENKTEFATLRPKTYNYLTDDKDEKKKKTRECHKTKA